MSFFDKLKRPTDGGYIFLSHSHDDIIKIREIRNSLEKEGFEPLCFYLKCLDDDSEVEDLIKREIDAREWFVFCDSENSRKSRWVTLEREYIAKANNKKIITIDIKDDISVRDAIRKITQNLRVFISCSYKDEKLARRIKNNLEGKDYLVFFAPDSISAGCSYVEIFSVAITEASKDGCVLVLLTEESVKSAWVEREVEKAIMEGGTVIPVMVGNFELPIMFELLLNNISFFRLSENPTDKEIIEMIDKISYDITNK